MRWTKGIIIWVQDTWKRKTQKQLWLLSEVNRRTNNSCYDKAVNRKTNKSTAMIKQWKIKQKKRDCSHALQEIEIKLLFQAVVRETTEQRGVSRQVREDGGDRRGRELY